MIDDNDLDLQIIQTESEPINDQLAKFEKELGIEYDPDFTEPPSPSEPCALDMIKQASNQSIESAKQKDASFKYGSAIDESLPTSQALSTLQSLEENVDT